MRILGSAINYQWNGQGSIRRKLIGCLDLSHFCCEKSDKIDLTKVNNSGKDDRELAVDFPHIFPGKRWESRFHSKDSFCEEPAMVFKRLIC